MESSDSSEEKANSLTIIHFNDVYNIEPREKDPVGGAARFATKVKELGWKNPLVLFSGDALSPSKISSITRGEQMIPILNALNVNTAVFGNHDFDFGVEHLVNVAKVTYFPWLMSNVVDKMTNRPLAEGLVKRIIKWEGRKIGLIGLVEYEWLVTLSTISPEDLLYTDYVECAKILVPQLIAEGCDLIIALTHMRMPNDVRLAESVSEIDIILGGHDHHYEVRKVNDVHILKSGSDFIEFSEVAVNFTVDKPSYVIHRHEITSDIKEDEEVGAVVAKYVGQTEESMKVEIGYIHCPLEGRFTQIRTRECNLGNLIADIMCRATNADCVILNSGTLRSDMVHDTGVFKMRDLFAVLPGTDPLLLLSITGDHLLLALENGVSQYPRLEGRFPQVSGIRFTFDPDQPSGKRIINDSVYVAGERLQPNKVYKLCTKEYIADGKDGYDILKRQQRLIDVDQAPILSCVVRNFFTDAANPKSLKRLSSRNSLMNMFGSENSPVTKGGTLMIKPEALEGIHNTVACSSLLTSEYYRLKEGYNVW
ncbi:5'-nucleotidase-like [Dysidea avara]|uniref:5'-nucleotidase-like n=1 Tax=Dysidea avara TaxID=196820 RepID=UPI003321CD96